MLENFKDSTEGNMSVCTVVNCVLTNFMLLGSDEYNVEHQHVLVFTLWLLVSIWYWS